jgi:hypothetical protein
MNRAVKIEDIKDAKAIILNGSAHSPRAFQVKTVPSDVVVYWSFSRKKANNFIRNLVAERELSVFFGETLKGKSLAYNYRYSPNEYFLGFIVWGLLSAFLTLSHPDEKFFALILFLLAMSCLIQGRFNS